jgi:hypothetical protein
LSSSIVSSITIDYTLLASSEGNGEGGGGGGNEENGSGERNGNDDEQQEDDQKEQEEKSIEDESKDGIPTEPPQTAEQGVTCQEGEVINPETGKCEETELEEVGNEICDNSIDDDLDKEVDESECEPLDEQSVPRTQTVLPSSAPTSMLPLDPSIQSFSPSTDVGNKGTSEATESIRKEGMMKPPTTTSPSSTAVPKDLIAEPLTSDPDYCLKQFGLSQLTGKPIPDKCKAGQNSGTPPSTVCPTSSTSSSHGSSGRIIFIADPFLDFEDPCKNPAPKLTPQEADKIFGKLRGGPFDPSPEPKTEVPSSSNSEPSSEPSTGQPSDNQPLPEPPTAPLSPPSNPAAAPSSFLGVGTFSKQPDNTRTITNVKTLDTVKMNADDSIIFSDAKGQPFGAVTSDGVVTFRTASGNVYVVGAGARAGDFSIDHVDDSGKTQPLPLDSRGVIESTTRVTDSSTGETVEKRSGEATFKDAAGKSFGAVVTTPDGTFVGWTQPENGHIYLVAPDRTVAILTPEGGSFKVGPDDVSTEQSPSGYTLTYFPNGGYSREDPETLITTTYDSDGKVVGKVGKDRFGNIKAVPTDK